MIKKKTKDIQLLLNPDEFEILSELDKDNICSRNMNYDSNDFVKEVKEHRWFVDDDKTICPDCKMKLERIKML